MSGPDAARLAAFHAAAAIESALANGWETLDRYGADRPRVESALNDLRAELDRRAGERTATKSGSTTAPAGAVVSAVPPRVDEPAAMPAPAARDEKQDPVTEAVPGTETAADVPEDDDRPGPSGRVQAVRELGEEWALDADDVLWRGQARVGSARRAGLSGSGWEARHASGSQVTTGAGPRNRYPSRIKALTALAAEADRAERERTPHADVLVDGLPAGWRLTQTQADRDDHLWRLISPSGETIGTVTRDDYGSRPEWRATAGDRSSRHYLPAPVTPAADDPARGTDYDLFRTRTAAARALADWHDPDL